MSVIVATNRPYVQVAGRLFTDIRNLIMLYTGVAGGTNQYGTFRRNNATSGYTPAAPAAYRPAAMRVVIQASPGNDNLLLYQSSNDVGFATSSAPTSIVPLFGSTSYGFYVGSVGVYEIDFGFGPTVSATAYLTASANGAATFAKIQVYGYEE